MSHSDHQASLSRRYEGQAILDLLLTQAGALLCTEEVKTLFGEAQAAGDPPSDVFPDLFEGEPRFPSPDLARRLYGNLFGLWDRIAAGLLDEPRASKPSRQSSPPPPPPRPEPLTGALTDAFVEEGFRHLSALSKQDLRRLRDRFEQRESDFTEAVRSLHVSPGAEAVGLDLAFEVWALSEMALGPRVGRTHFEALRTLPGTLTPQPQPQPPLARYLERVR